MKGKPPPTVGRPPRISKEAERRLADSIPIRDTQLNSFTRKKLKKWAADEVAQANSERPLGKAALKPLSPATFYRLKQRVTPEHVKQGTTQNEQRQMVLCFFRELTIPKAGIDIRNAMSLCAILGAICEDHLSVRQCLWGPDGLVNVDAFSHVIEEKPQELLLGEGSLAKLKAAHLSPADTKTQPQRRTVKILTAFTATGRMACAITIVKDSNVKKRILRSVCCCTRSLISAARSRGACVGVGDQ